MVNAYAQNRQQLPTGNANGNYQYFRCGRKRINNLKQRPTLICQHSIG